MRDEYSKSAVENLASHRIHGVLPKKYHMQYRSGQEELVEEQSLKEIERLIRQASDSANVPEGLLPENIERKLQSVRRKKIRRRKCLAVAGVVLSVCVLAFVVLAWKNRHITQGYEELHPIYSYEQLYDHYMGLAEKGDPYVSYGGVNLGMSMMSSSIADQMSSGNTMGAASRYTSANVREDSVGEADFTATDGDYIYTVYWESGEANEETWQGLESRLEVMIRKADGQEAAVAGTIQKTFRQVETYRPWEPPVLYIYGDILALVYSSVGDGWALETNLSFYDVSDRSHPRLIREVVQSGIYKECREVDGYLYVISSKTDIQVNGLRKKKESVYIPMVDGKKLPLNDIYLQQDVQGNAYDLISSWDLSETGEYTDAKALVGYYDTVYMTAGNIYFCNTRYANTEKKEKTDSTHVSRLACEKGKIRGDAMVYFPGTMGSSFSIQEHGDELWVTTQVMHYVYREDLEKKKKKTDKKELQKPEETEKAFSGDPDAEIDEKDGLKIQLREWGEEDDVEDLDYWYSDELCRTWTDVSVHTFDSRLRRLDSLDGLVRDETIFAVRYVGETGYFVSYEQTDPLVSVDMSDASRLRVLDELVMPGFSRYLHPVEDDLLLGVGEQDNGKVKLDLYDVSDTRRLSRLCQEALEGMYHCAVFENYRWFMVDEEKQLFGVCAAGNNGSYYFVYHYDREQGLQQVKKVKLRKRGGWEGIRWQGFHIGKDLYLIENGGERRVRVAAME